ncbi:hypothetical protein B4N89_31305 [Embleya scabrispora]|uniref:DUF4926 domain-containing protein n=1 Tax=Embleya scabrispora TaxID=159449 RepID=A0A1T3NPM1_9ACTN|nr:hypothetical protein [Embleya scabrispora]OPC78660.1 hypothetical protein B4N89_31305 [Embleya scabrispora]
MEIGTKVRAITALGGGLRQEVPENAEGWVVAKLFGGDIEVAFTLPGLLGGTRTVNVPVDPIHVAPL